MAETTLMKRVQNRRRAMLVLPFAIAILAMLGLQSPAFADGNWSTSQWSGCSTAWTWDQYGGTALAHESYSATTSAGTYARINSATAWVDNQEDCGPSGLDVSAYQINLHIQFKFRGSGLSCGGGSPGAFTCNIGANGDYLLYDYYGSCGNYILNTCRASFGTVYFYPPPGKHFDNVAWMQTWVTLVRSDGNNKTWSTMAV